MEREQLVAVISMGVLGFSALFIFGSLFVKSLFGKDAQVRKN